MHKTDLTQQRGTVPLTLDRPRVLFYSLASTSLLVEKYGVKFLGEIYHFKSGDGRVELELKSVDALAFFLWAGLQDELAGTDETFTLEQAAALLAPFAVHRIFTAVTSALMKTVVEPVVPGKAAAAVLVPKPAAKKKPAKKKLSTLKSRSGLRSAR